MNGSHSANVDLLSAMVIILVSAAITIFLFWLASQIIGHEVLAELPTFITGAFKGIVTALLTASAAVALEVVRRMTTHQPNQPNYLKLIGITTICLIGGVFLLATVLNFMARSASSSVGLSDKTAAPSKSTSQPSPPHPHPNIQTSDPLLAPPPGVLKANSIGATPATFTLKNQNPNESIQFTVLGILSKRTDGSFAIQINDAELTANGSLAAIAIQKVSFRICKFTLNPPGYAPTSIFTYPTQQQDTSSNSRSNPQVHIGSNAHTGSILLSSFLISNPGADFIQHGWLCAFVAASNQSYPYVLQ